MGIIPPHVNHKNILGRIFNYCFIIAIIIILGCSIFFISGNSNLGKVNRVFLILIVTVAVVIGVALLWTTFRFFSKKSEYFNLNIQKINWIITIIMAFIIAYTVQMNNQLSDGHSCIKIAQQLAPTMNWHDVPYGSQASGYCYALIRCVNMAPLIYLQALVFKFFALISIKLSFSGMVAIGTYTNTVLLLVSLYLAFKLIKKYCSISIQTGFSFLLIINIPLYATVYYVYTDIPSLFAVMLIITAYDTFISTEVKKKKVNSIIVIISASIIGALFKFNVLIATCAILIHYLLINNWKKNVKFILLLLVPTLIGISGIKHEITATAPIPKEEIGLPATNWINMSFNDSKTNGGFDNRYFAHTYELKAKYKTNSKVSCIELTEFINSFVHHPQKYFYIMYRKIGAIYGQGTYDFNSFFRANYLAHPNMKKTPLGQLFYGKFRKIYLYSTFVIQLSLFTFTGIAVLKLIKNKIDVSNVTPWLIALFGNMFMLLFWEAHARYLLAFVGLIYMIACLGFEKSEKIQY